MRTISFFLFTVLFLVACTNTNHTQDIVKEAFIKKLLTAPEFDFAKNSKGILIIYKDDYSGIFDTKAYFKDYENELLFYAKEDLFMRNSYKYLEILEVNESTKTMKIKMVNGHKNVSGTTIQL